MNPDLAAPAFLIPLAFGAAIGAAGLWAFTHLDRIVGVVGGVERHVAPPSPSPRPRLHLVGDAPVPRPRRLGRGHCRVVDHGGHEDDAPTPVALFLFDDQLDGAS